MVVAVAGIGLARPDEARSCKQAVQRSIDREVKGFVGKESSKEGLGK
jgi:hypothetical protein